MIRMEPGQRGGTEEPAADAALGAAYRQALEQYADGRLVEAERGLRQAVDVATGVLDGTSPYVARMLVLLSDIQRDLERSHSAEASLRRAVDLLSAGDTDGFPEEMAVARLLDLLIGTRRYEEARRLGVEALVRNWDEGHLEPRILPILTRLAEIEHRVGNTEAAERWVRFAVGTIMASTRDAPLLSVLGLDHLGGEWQRKRMNAAAHEAYAQAVEIGQRTWGTDSLEIVNPLSGMAALSAADGDMEGAVKLFERALAIVGSTEGRWSSRYSSLQEEMAQVLAQAGDTLAAVELLRRALEVRSRNHGEDSREVALVLWRLANMIERTGEIQTADR